MLARSPERYIKSQLHDTHSVETMDSVTGDSSLSSNQNLSRSVSSEASFTDEDEDSSGERVCLALFLHHSIFGFIRPSSELNCVNVWKKFMQLKRPM